MKDENDTYDEDRDDADRADDRDDDRGGDADVDESGTIKTLGLERWVQFAFVALAGLTFFIGDKLITFVWSYFAEPQGTVVAGVAAILGILTGYVAYRQPRVKAWADEVAGELAKVTWPTRRETWYSTVVVIVTSVIAAVYLGAFDALWSAFTDLIYSTT